MNRKIKKILIKSLLLSLLFTVITIDIFLLNIMLDESLIDFIKTFKTLNSNHNYLFISKLLFLHLSIYFVLIIFGYAICDKIYKKISRKINILWLIIPFIFLITTRSIITEPFLYQVFYESSNIFQTIMNALLFFDIKLILDIVIIAIIILSLIWVLRFYSLVIFFIIAVGWLFYDNSFQTTNNIQNNETIIFVMIDSLRKDAVEDNHELFINKIYKQSTVLDNMYTTFPASVPSMASIFANDYAYKYRATALSLDTPMDMSFVNQLKQEYLISLHTDFTDDDVKNRKNFDIPFDKISAPYIDHSTTFDANIIKKDVGLLSLISNNFIRNLLIPEYFQSDGTANSRNSINLFTKYLNNHRQDKKIAFLSLGENHIPFEAKYPYYKSFPANINDNKYNWIFDYHDYKYNGDNLVSNQNIRNLYMMTVLSIDDEIKYLFNRLAAAGLLENTKIVFLSDQGENIYDNDLNLYSHNNIDSKHVINVPFFIYEHDKNPSPIDGNYSLIDTINLGLYSDEINNYKKDFIYLESDVDVHNTSSKLYIDKAGTFLDVSDINNIKIIDNNLLQKHKKRALIYQDYILIYKPESEDIYALYNLEDDYLFQNNIKDINPDIFNMMKLKLDEFIEDTKNY